MPSHIKPTIHQFQIIRPEFVLKQAESIDWLSKAHSLVEKDDLDLFIYITFSSEK